MGLITRMLKLEAAKAKAAFKKQPQRQDLNLPLGIRVGSTVNIDPASFILGGDALVFVAPQGRCLAKGYSRLHIGDFDYLRLYLEDEPKRAFILQIGLDEGKPAEFILYQPFLDPEACPEGEIYPADKEEWRQWIGDKKGWIGDQYFEIPGGTQYDRTIMPEQSKRIQPFEYTEVGAFNEFAMPAQMAGICGMTYGRTITANGQEVKEFCLPEKREDSDGAFITVFVGVELAENEISVL